MTEARRDVRVTAVTPAPTESELIALHEAFPIMWPRSVESRRAAVNRKWRFSGRTLSSRCL